MPKISDIISNIYENPKPVLLVDTCAILDIIRSPYQEKYLDCLESAIAVIRASTPEQEVCTLVIGSIVSKEFSENIEIVENELDKSLSDLQEKAKLFYRACDLVGLERNFSYIYNSSRVLAVLRQMAESLIKQAHVIEAENKYQLLATKRVVEKKPPAQKGTLKDSIITEEYLEIARQLSSRNFRYPIVFISSNVSDFCLERKLLHPDLDSEFSSVNLNYCRDWKHAASLLVIEEGL